MRQAAARCGGGVCAWNAVCMGTGCGLLAASPARCSSLLLAMLMLVVVAVQVRGWAGGRCAGACALAGDVVCMAAISPSFTCNAACRRRTKHVLHAVDVVGMQWCGGQCRTVPCSGVTGLVVSLCPGRPVWQPPHALPLRLGRALPLHLHAHRAGKLLAGVAARGARASRHTCGQAEQDGRGLWVWGAPPRERLLFVPRRFVRTFLLCVCR